MRHGILLVLFVLACAHSQSVTGDSVKAAFGGSGVGVGTRALGMGGAYTAVADDPSALYWNPAGLAHAHGVNLAMPFTLKTSGIDALGELAAEAFDVYDAIKDGAIDRDQFDSLRDVALRVSGRPVSATGGTMAGLATSGIGFGVWGKPALTP